MVLAPKKVYKLNKQIRKNGITSVHGGRNYLFKAMKLVKDGGGNKMYASWHALQRFSHKTVQEFSIRECVLLVTSHGLSSSVSLSFTGQERGERTGLLKTPGPQEPASPSCQPASRNRFTPPLPASPSSSQQIPQAYTVPTKTLSHYVSLLLWKPIWREESMAFSNKLCMSSSLLASDPASSVMVWHFIQHTTNTRACRFTALSLWENHLIPLPVRHRAASIHQQSFKKTWKQPRKATLSLHYFLSCHRYVLIAFLTLKSLHLWNQTLLNVLNKMPCLSHGIWPDNSGNSWSWREKAVKYIALLSCRVDFLSRRCNY